MGLLLELQGSHCRLNGQLYTLPLLSIDPDSDHQLHPQRVRGVQTNLAEQASFGSLVSLYSLVQKESLTILDSVYLIHSQTHMPVDTAAQKQ